MKKIVVSVGAFLMIFAVCTQMPGELELQQQVFLLGVPTDVEATVQSATAVTVAWDPVVDATYYKVWRKDTTASAVFGVIDTATTSPYTDLTAANGTWYLYAVSAATEFGDTSALSASDSVLTWPEAVSGLAATTLSSASILLSWSTVTGATSYKVHRSESVDGPFVEVGTSNSSPYTDGGLVASTTYYYALTSTNSSGMSGFSSTANATTQAAATTAPGAPSGLSAQALSSSAITLSWSASSGATEYRIYRSPTQGSGYSFLNSSVTNAYTDNGLQTSTTYYYVVSAKNAYGESNYSSEVSGVTEAEATLAPDIPSGVAAAALASDRVQVTWNAAARATSYKVYRSDSASGTYYLVNTVTGSPYTDPGLVASTTYYYKVSGVNGVGESGQSLQAWATTQAPPQTAPGVPLGVEAVTQSSVSIQVRWNSVTGATYYRVFRRDSTGVDFAEIGTASASPLNDTGLTPSTRYYYSVKAANSSGSSDTSSQVSARTSDPPQTPPPAPTGVVATPKSSVSIDVQWNAALGATRYTIYRKQGLTGNLDSVAATGTTSWSDNGLDPKTIYTYRIKATNTAGGSALSDPASATTFDPPQLAPEVPRNVTVTSVSSYEISLSWAPSLGAQWYRILAGTAAGTPIDSVQVTSTSGTLRGLAPGSAYYLSVKAGNTIGTSDASPEITASTQVEAIPAPSNLQTSIAWSAAGPSVTLTWNALTVTVDRYAVLRKIVPSTAFDSIGMSRTAQFIDSTASAATTYLYVVVAITPYGGRSGNSLGVTAAIPAYGIDAPLNVRSTVLTGILKPKIEWDSVAGAERYTVQRSIATGGPYDAVGQVVGQLSLVDSTAVPGSTYYYTVVARSAAGVLSGSSAEHTVILPPRPPGMPQNVTATPASARSIGVQWDSASGAVRYTIYHYTSPSTYDSIATTAALSFVDTPLTPGASYCYAVQATNSGGSSSMSATACASTVAPPSAPANVYAMPRTPRSVLVSWDSASGASEYTVFHFTSPSTYDSIATVATLSYVDSPLTPATSYCYAVMASNEGGSSAASAPACTTTLLGIPGNVLGEALSPTEIAMRWNRVPGAAGYQVRYGPAGGALTYWAVGDSDTTVITALEPDSLYSISVAAYSGTIWSEYSPDLNVRTQPIPWQPVGTTPLSIGEVFYTDIILPGSGEAYVAYTDVGDQNRAYVNKFTPGAGGGTWSVVGGGAVSNSGSMNVGLAMAGVDPYLVFADGGYGYGATVEYYSSTAQMWYFSGSPGITAGTYFLYPSLVVDQAGTQYIAYRDEVSGIDTGVTIRQYNPTSGTWDSYGGIRVTGYTPTWINLSMGRTGLWFSCLDDQNTPKVWQYSGTNWVPHVSGPNSASALRMAADTAGSKLYLAYIDDANSLKASVLGVNETTPSSFSVGTPYGVSPGRVDDVDIAVTASGVPYLAYNEYQGRVSVMKFNGTSWVRVGPVDFSAGEARKVSIAVDDAFVYVAFADHSVGGRLRVMRHVQ